MRVKIATAVGTHAQRRPVLSSYGGTAVAERILKLTTTPAVVSASVGARRYNDSELVTSGIDRITIPPKRSPWPHSDH
jgi:hypothetical protein